MIICQEVLGKLCNLSNSSSISLRLHEFPNTVPFLFICPVFYILRNWYNRYLHVHVFITSEDQRFQINTILCLINPFIVHIKIYILRI